MKQKEEAKKARVKTGARVWTLIWLLGVAGQICWNMENQWFNTFVYAKIGKDPSIITGMLIFSAAATTFSTFFFGTWSDRLGKRRIFISLGYILWGIFTIVFGLTQFISVDHYVLMSVMVVLADTVMSFFGSMGSDAAFNAWTNDLMTDQNRGQIGAALATQPVLGTLLGTVVGGLLVGSGDHYMRLFLVMGIIVIAFGILSAFSMNSGDDVAPSRRGSFWKQFASVFDFRSFFQRKELVCVFLSVMIFFIGFNIYFAYLGNYLIYYLGFTADQMGIIEAVPLVLAMLTSIPVSGLINRNHHFGVSLFAIAINAVGLWLMVPVKAGALDTSKIFHPILFIGILLVGIGYIDYIQTARVWCKQLYPADSRGQFEGIWIIFFVLLPMIGGSLIGQKVVTSSGETFLDAASAQIQYIPNGNIFLVGSLISILSLIPLIFARREFVRRNGLS